MLDSSTPRTARALERLGVEPIAWLTSVTSDGQPQAMPVWFLWEDGEILMYSQKGARRNANLRANPRVSFHLQSDARGDDIVSIDGEARFEAGPAAKDHPAYLAKYGDWLREYDWTPEYFSDRYPEVVRIRPTRVRIA